MNYFFIIGKMSQRPDEMVSQDAFGLRAVV